MEGRRTRKKKKQERLTGFFWFCIRARCDEHQSARNQVPPAIRWEAFDTPGRREALVAPKDRQVDQGPDEQWMRRFAS